MPVTVDPPVAIKVMDPGVPVGLLLRTMLVPEIEVTSAPVGMLVPLTVMPTTMEPEMFVSEIIAFEVVDVTSAYFKPLVVAG